MQTDNKNENFNQYFESASEYILNSKKCNLY